MSAGDAQIVNSAHVGGPYVCAYCGHEWMSRWTNIPSRVCPKCHRVRVSG